MQHKANRISHGNLGFTLLEVVITLGILMGMTLAITQTLRSGFDLRLSLSQSAKVTRRLNVAMEKISYDLSHAFLIDSRISARTNGRKRTIFKVERGADSDKLSLTYTGHISRVKDAKESDLAYVVYDLRESKIFPGRKNLYRGESPHIPESFKDDPPMEMLAENISSLRIDGWLGDDWSRDGWDSTRKDTENKLPHMVRVIIQAWNEDRIEGLEGDENSETSMHQFASIIYIPTSLDFDEVKARFSSFKL